MAKQTVNLGTMADNKSGDPLRTAFTKINQNFDELYTSIGVGGGTVSVTGGVDLENAVALDITKKTHKLSSGFYTLGDGSEGQVIYLVRQTGNTSDLTTRVYVTNQCRIAGNEYTNNYMDAFLGYDVVTLMYTDSAWQSIGGQWD